MAERDKVRTAFISVDGCTNLKTLADELNNDRLTYVLLFFALLIFSVQEFLLRFDPCNPLQERIRIRVCPPICSHPLIKLRDVELTRKLAKKLGEESNILHYDVLIFAQTLKWAVLTIILLICCQKI